VAAEDRVREKREKFEDMREKKIHYAYKSDILKYHTSIKFRMVIVS
jgi:hypothetical protein